MAEIDKTKEEIGWIKVAFAMLLATDISLVAWTVRNFFELPLVLSILSVMLTLAVVAVTVVVNRKAYEKIEQLGEM